VIGRLGTRVIHGDDTSVKLPVLGSRRTKKAHLWVGNGEPDYPYVVFNLTIDHTAGGPTRFFAGFAGYFQADALSSTTRCTPRAG
jgi:transposase